MSRFVCLILIAFLQNFTVMLVGEGVYFYSRHEFAFTGTENLLLGLGRGAVYVSAALASHGLCVRWGERRLMMLTLLGQGLSYLSIWLFAGSASMLVAGSIAYNLFSGAKWPVIESYFSAGQTPRESARMVGWYNLSWSLSAGLGMAAAGPLIASTSAGTIFGVSIVLDVLTMLMGLALEPRMKHLAADHPERLPAQRIAWFDALLDSSRWSLLLSYTLFYSMSPLLPDLFHHFAVPLTWATVLAALLHAARFVTFVWMWWFAGWHGRAWTQVAAIIGLPLGYAMIVCEQSLALLVIGQIVFGVSAGLAYYAALYYAMVVKDSSVDAGGKHEAVIGSGAVVGPVVGLGSMWLGVGMLAGMGAVVLGATGLSVRALKRKFE